MAGGADDASVPNAITAEPKPSKPDGVGFRYTWMSEPVLTLKR
jgi:hypothetical protein